jgi:pimeloyl-ACP methyl ester carboxylesterase
MKWWPLLVAPLLLAGCARSIAERVSRSPNYQPEAAGLPWHSEELALAGFTPRLMSLAAGQTLRVVIQEPGQEATLADDRSWWRPGPEVPPIGTVLVLHPMYGHAEYLAGTAMALADAGLRVIAVDLPGHGRSSSAPISFGAGESRAVRRVLAELEREGRLVPPVVLLGASLGAATALMAGDAPQVDAVVAVAPFARVGEVAENFTGLAPWYVRWLPMGWLVPDVVEELGRIGGFDPVQESPLAWSPRLRVPVLLVHGDPDTLVPASQSARLREVIPDVERIVYQVDEDHIPFCAGAGYQVEPTLAFLHRRFGLPVIPALGEVRLRIGRPAPAPGEVALTSWRHRGAAPLAPGLLAGRTADGDALRSDPRPRPDGERLVIGFPRIPLEWTGQDLEVVLGQSGAPISVWWDGICLGEHPLEGPVSRTLSYRLPFWRTMPGPHRLVIHLRPTDAGHGIRLVAGSGVLRPVRTTGK